jgi:GT2 family glycosyltransferase
LQNLVGPRPLVLGELGMDTLRNGETAQAKFLVGHLREATLMGLAGAFIFSWTDDWHTGGHPIEDWGFGITRRDRLPKASYHALREVFEVPSASLLERTPRVSVVVCSYNGGRTLEQCLRSLSALDYPDYEVIVVDDGSTDDTRDILAHFADVRVIHQPNRGLSIARNAGLKVATGSIIAYTDSDCFVDPNWLSLLVYQFQRSDAAAVGGPNLSPDDGWMAGCVAAAPGQPTHVLESDQVAEHIPGCNMAFRREALEAINGFDPQYRKAGDDVDVCWRLQHAGYWITFAPGAFVWHHRRCTPRAYLRQQAGYGEAEAWLQFKHPDKFNGRGESKWRGVLYGASLRGLSLGRDMIYRGTFGAGMFQCLYGAGPSHWAMLPCTLEWHLAAALAAVAGSFWWPAWILVAVMLTLSAIVATLQGVQANLAPQHEGLRARLLVIAMCYVQPLIRSWARYRTRLFSYGYPISPADAPWSGGQLPSSADNAPTVSAINDVGLAFTGRRNLAYWSELGHDRTELLGIFLAHLVENRWGTTVDSGWADWDLEVHYHPWTYMEIATAQEEHGGGKRLIRLRCRLRITGLAKIVAALAFTAVVILAGIHPLAAGIGLSLCAAVWLGAWRQGIRLASRAVKAFDGLALGMDLIRCLPAPVAVNRSSETCCRQGSGVGDLESGDRNQQSPIRSDP